MSTNTSVSPKVFPIRRLLVTGLIIILGIAVTTGFVWMGALTYTPMSSFQSSGWAAMNASINEMHSCRFRMTSSTPRERT